MLIPSSAGRDRNLLLKYMKDEDYALIEKHLERCSADKAMDLFKCAEPTQWIWFIEKGVGSLINRSPEGLAAECGLFGRDGFAPVSAVMGSDRSHLDGVIQVADSCQRMRYNAFREAISQSESLRDLFLRYAHTLNVQMAHTALSNAVHQVDERLARWLLMTHDRVDGSELPLTHDFLSIMLAVRRPSVTTALHVLEGNGFIRAERGCVIIRNRAALEEFAADSYGKPELEYERLIGPLR